MALTDRNAGTKAIITGGAQGIGLAIAKQLVAEGCRSLALVGRTAEKGRDAVAELKALGAEAIFITADVSDVNACVDVVTTAIGTLGSVNALVNAAATSARGSLTETTPELFDLIFNTNVKGPFFLMQGVVRHLIETKKPGSIVNVLSMSGHGGQPFLAPYSASKGALAILTKNAANAYRKRRIRVNAVMPGWMDTPNEAVVQAKFHGAGPDWLEKAEAAQPMGQLAKTHQLAGLVTYMLSPESGVMTGSLVDYDQNIVGTGE
ncbi:MAG: SDR family oxidoreductase [Rhizobiaceae bacterium]|nr:SDR family oxidoreductase [Rhizobiaceae bacterium]